MPILDVKSADFRLIVPDYKQKLTIIGDYENAWAFVCHREEKLILITEIHRLQNEWKKKAACYVSPTQIRDIEIKTRKNKEGIIFTHSHPAWASPDPSDIDLKFQSCHYVCGAVYHQTKNTLTFFNQGVSVYKVLRL